MAALKGKVTLDKLPCVQKIRNHIRTLEGSVYASIEVDLSLKAQPTFILSLVYCRLANKHGSFHFTKFVINYLSAKLNL